MMIDGGGDTLTLESDGWVAYRNDRFPGVVHVYLEQAPSGRWWITRVHLEADRISARDLRAVPLGKIEAWVNWLAWAPQMAAHVSAS
jgi:hypothetical protein